MRGRDHRNFVRGWLAWHHTYKPLPRAPVFVGVLGQVKRTRIGDDRIVRISPLPRAPVFAGFRGTRAGKAK